jgi:hypothetical protein
MGSHVETREVILLIDISKSRNAMIAVDFSVDDMNQCYSTMKCQMEFHPITMKPML